MPDYSDPISHAGFRKSMASGLIYKSVSGMAPLEATPQGKLVILANTTNITDMDKEKILPGAWGRVVASSQKPRIMIGHAIDQIPVGKATSLEEWQPGDYRLPQWHQQNGAGGLIVTAQINMKSQRGQEFHSAVLGGYLAEFSVGFLAGPNSKTYRNDGVTEIGNVDELVEVSGVVRGSSPQTQALEAKAKGYGRNYGDGDALDWICRHPDEAERLVEDAVNRWLDRRQEPSFPTLRPYTEPPKFSLDHGAVAIFRGGLDSDDVPRSEAFNSLRPKT